MLIILSAIDIQWSSLFGVHIVILPLPSSDAMHTAVGNAWQLDSGLCNHVLQIHTCILFFDTTRPYIELTMSSPVRNCSNICLVSQSYFMFPFPVCITLLRATHLKWIKIALCTTGRGLYLPLTKIVSNAVCLWRVFRYDASSCLTGAFVKR